jgi:hypothetical protein
LLDGGGALAAYGFLLAGPGKIDGLGPAFFTKFLYFMGYGRAGGTLQPLILDSRVARNLNALRSTGWKTTGWPLAQYEEYLEWARTEAMGPGPVTSADEAEFRIWS